MMTFFFAPCLRFGGACIIALLGLLGLPAAASTTDTLVEYVSRPDPSYGWREVGSGRIGSVEYAELILTSQTWRGFPWKHQLIVFRPKKLGDGGNDHAFLFIHGGRWREEYENGWKDGLPREARIFARLAQSLGAPLGVIRQVPHQPLFGRTEDALIAYTFDQYLETGDASWPLLLPMVKSAVRGMDAMQEFAAARWQSAPSSFTVSGASKRGWTSWLTAAVDARVSSVAPMVIDMLNIPQQIELQKASFGTLSEEVQDYADINLPARIGSERGQSLLEMVDPYRYRERLTQPKLILLGTNDPYWPLEALGVYWSGLREPKHVLYLPNQQHGLKDYRRLIGSLTALHRRTARGEPMPQLSWDFTTRGRSVALTVGANEPPRRVRAWMATSPTRDFREARWTQRSCRRASNGRYLCDRPLAEQGYTALYAEVVFKDPDAPEYSLSTTVYVAGSSDGESPGSRARNPL